MTFLAFYTKACNLSHKIPHLPLFKPFYPQNLLFTPKLYYFFLLVSPLQMVSPGAARPLRPRLSTPLHRTTATVDRVGSGISFCNSDAASRGETQRSVSLPPPSRPTVLLRP